MSKIPIPNNKNTQIDPTYRYMRNQIQISKSGQFIILDNIDQICKQLKVNKSVLVDWIPKYLGQSIKIINDKIAIKSKTIDELELMIECFILKYICCKKCLLPEIIIDKNICNSCGMIQI